MLTTYKPQLLAILALGAPVLGQHDLPATHGPPQCSNPLTWGFYATPETRSPATLEVVGTIPSWLTGSLYRGAAATWDVGNYTSEHWFDGFSRNHQFTIANGAVTYHSRNSTDELTAFVQETGLYPNGAFGSDPCKIIFGAFEATFRDETHQRGDRSAENVGVAFINNYPGLQRNQTDEGGYLNTLVVTTDANSLLQINPITLEPIELFNYAASSPLLNGSRSSAHPAVLSDGSIYNYVLDLEEEVPTYRVFGTSAPYGETKTLANITDAPPAYLHSTFNTQNHIILIVWQADIVQPGRTLMESLGPWDPNRPVLFYVIDRVEGGVIAKYTTEQSFFAFHQINSFEDEEGNIFIDLPRMDDLSFINNAHVENLRANLGRNSTSFSDIAGEFTRFRLPYHGDAGLSNDSVQTYPAEIEFTLPYTSANIELARVNPAYEAKPYQFAYGVHSEAPGSFADSIIKLDLQAREWKVWQPSSPHLPSEPIFVPTPNAESEDDGILLTVAMDAEERHSALVFIDASSMEEVARARMPITVGYGFHGTWGGPSY